jgi:hypothetical protein
MIDFNKNWKTKTYQKHLIFQYRDLLWYFPIREKDLVKLKGVWGEVDKNDGEGLQKISNSFKDYYGKDFENNLQHGLIYHFYKKGYFEKDENDIFWLGITCGKDGLYKELHELDKGENFSWTSWGKELKKITNQDKFLNTMLETYYGEKKGSGKDVIYSILKNLVSLPVLSYNIEQFHGNLKNKWVNGKDKELLEELLYQSQFHLFFLKKHEKRDDWFPKMKESIGKLIDGIIEDVIDFSHSSSYQHKRFMECNGIVLPMEERIKNREKQKRFFEKELQTIKN